MSNIERWWRVTRPSDGHVTWTPEDPSDRLTAAWKNAKVEGPFVLEARGAVCLTLGEAAMLEVLAREEVARHRFPPHDLVRARDKLTAAMRELGY